jgi:5-methylcytosine-specific restriction endonuclease McrA
MLLPIPGVRAPLSDEDLEDRLKRLAAIEHRALAWLLGHLGEFDRRKLYAERGHPSLFSYCTRVLGYSEQAAYKRIQAARAARHHPILLERIASGTTTLAAAVILAPHLRTDNAASLLESASGKSKRELEDMAARLAPREEVPDLIRMLPGPGAAEAHQGIARAAGADGPAARKAGPATRIRALSENRHLFRFTGTSGLRDKLERARSLLGMPPLESVIETAVEGLLGRIDPVRRDGRRIARVRQEPAGARPRNRKVSAALRDAVWTRDGGRCTFVAPDGGRCPATDRLELDHIKPYALGGASDDAANLRLLCRTHNQLQARRMFNYPRG